MRRPLASARVRLLALVLLCLTPTLGLALALAHATGTTASQRSLAVLAVGAALVLVAVWFAGEYYLLRPLRTLRHATEQMAAGDLTARVPPQACAAELAKLGTCFNTMAAALEARTNQLARQAAYDALTGLPNRALFLNRLAKALNDQEDPAVSLAVLFLDLDGFKAVNDRLGHAAGDELLALVAQRLVQCVRPQDTVARFGGDEFLVLVERLQQPAAVDGVATRLLDRLARPYAVSGHPLQLSVSIGMALGTPGESRPEELLRRADTALYQAKDAGKAQAVWYDAQMGAQAADRLDLSDDLRTALARGELVLHYQPEVDLHSGAVVGLEALVRWQHPSRGLLPPTSFLTLAEEAGLAGNLTQWVLEIACRQLQAWEVLRPDGPLLRVSVNLSARQFQERDLVRRVAQLLYETGLHPRCLQLELAEAVLLDHTAAVTHTLAALRQLGVRLAIDQFGVGQWSLPQLQRAGVDLVKLDQAFVQRLPAAEAAAMLQAVTSAATALGVEVAAPGIETGAQLAASRALGCRTGQGYYLARPGEAAATRPVLDPTYRAFAETRL